MFFAITPVITYKQRHSVCVYLQKSNDLQHFQNCNHSVIAPVSGQTNDVICSTTPTTLTGYYNDSLLSFTIYMPFDGDMVIDARDSNTTDNNRIGIELFFPDGSLIVDGDNDPGGLKDAYADDFLLLGVTYVDNGTYTMNFFVGYPPPQDEYGTYNLEIYCTTSAPTSSPTDIPTTQPTPAPTDPENITCSDDSYFVTGDYNDELLTFYIEVTEYSNITIDARNSTADNGNTGIIGLEFKFSDGTTITDNDNDPGTISDQYPDDFLLLGVGDLEEGNYRLDYFIGYPPPRNETGTFVMSIRCDTNPTPSPTPAPTVPSNLTCSTSEQTISGEYNDAILTFYITLEFEGDITIDVRNSSGFESMSLIGIELTFPDGTTTVADGDNDPGVIGDEYPDEFLLLKVSDLDVGTYELNYFVGFPPPLGHFGDFVLTLYCDTNAPTKAPTEAPTASPSKEPTPDPTFEPTPRPTKSPSVSPTRAPTTEQPTSEPSSGIPTASPTTSEPTFPDVTIVTAAPPPTIPPTTPAPTQPGVVTRGQTILGDYNDDDVTFTVETSCNCSLATFDASDSEVDGVTVTVTDSSGSVLVSGSESVTYDDLPIGNYTVTLTADDGEFGDFEFTFLCLCDTTTSTSTTARPSRSPTERPSYEPTPYPTTRPIRIVSAGGSDSSDDDSNSNSAVLSGVLGNSDSGSSGDSGGGSDSDDSDGANGFIISARSASVVSSQSSPSLVVLSESDTLREGGADVGGDDTAIPVSAARSDADYVLVDNGHSAMAQDEGTAPSDLWSVHMDAEVEVDGTVKESEDKWVWNEMENAQHLEVNLSPSTLAMAWAFFIVFICCLSAACWCCRILADLTGYSFENEWAPPPHRKGYAV